MFENNFSIHLQSQKRSHFKLKKAPFHILLMNLAINIRAEMKNINPRPLELIKLWKIFDLTIFLLNYLLAKDFILHWKGYCSHKF